ncbi:MAG: glycosyltransferase [Anaerolineae bacterium]|nr:glycosyltransferase [Anaerolineae bacterium]
MRIFYAAGSSPNRYQLSDSKLWKYNLHDSLVDLGHEVISFDKDVKWHLATYPNYETSDEAYSKFLAYKSELQTSLVEQIDKEHRKKPFDVFFSYFWTAICDPETVEEIKRMGITTINWYCNASYQFHLVKDLAPAYHYSLVPEKFRLDDYRHAGANPIYCQEAANPTIYHPYDLPVTYDVVFVGQRYGNRPIYIAELARAGIDVRAFGPGWIPNPVPRRPLWRGVASALKYMLLERSLPPKQSSPNHIHIPLANCGPSLTDEEYVQMYSRSKISLGFTSVAGCPLENGKVIKQVRLRDFEAPMSGAFYMVEYFDELEEFFEPNKEIVFYSDPSDLVDKARHYLSHDTVRNRIRQASMKRARAEHTWQKRFKMVFETIGFQ